MFVFVFHAYNDYSTFYGCLLKTRVLLSYECLKPFLCWWLILLHLRHFRKTKTLLIFSMFWSRTHVML